ncbi:hypothetical protein Y027_1949 [Burkholderia pseudomallei TSV5]|nr:hypothetical protein Y024_4762 [Burkholderia pseudomallei TSV44]KGX62875.1 hypothetical protein Y027_1949 [Burkholderia pseudomallei TSV5]
MAEAGHGRACARNLKMAFCGFVNDWFKTFIGKSEEERAVFCVVFAGLHFSHSFRSVRWITVFECWRFGEVESY